jgi:hypothetical protein
VFVKFNFAVQTLKLTTTMAEILSVPDGNQGIPFSIPIGGNGNGLFGGGNTNLIDILGFAIIASMFGWNNGGFGGFGGNGANGAGFISNQLNNENGRQLIMQAVTSNGEAQRTAIQSLATTIGQDFNLVNGAVMNVQNSLNQIANAQGTNALQIINAIQSGNANIISQFQNCCCQQQLLTERQTNTLQNSGNANTQAILNKLSEMQANAMQDKLNAALAENAKLSGELSQSQQNGIFAGMITNAINPVVAQLAGIRSEVDAIKRCQPATITLPNNSMTAVPSIWANAVADNIVDKVSTALNGIGTTTTTPTTGA